VLIRRLATGGVAAVAAGIMATGLALPAGAAVGTTPDLARAVRYLVTTTGANGSVDGTSLTNDGYYEIFDQFGDFGLTIDGAFALAATGTDNTTLAKVVHFIDQRGTDESSRSVDDWTGIGTPYASGGAIGKEALLAEITGFDPRDFGGHDLIAELDAVICTTTDVNNGCAGPGNYLYATSTFAQALGVIAQLRAGDSANAASTIAYLRSLQNANGSWPSLIPDSGDSDIDSTAMAAMALALLPTDATAAAAVAQGTAWIASKQNADGAFPGTAGESTNSAGLAIQGLTLAGSSYATQIGKALAFLAGQQNADGGFDVAAGGQQGSDVRASAQVVGGVVGTSFGTLSNVIPTEPSGSTTTTSATIATTTTRATTVTTAAAGATTVPTTTGVINGAATGAGRSETLPATGSGATASLVFGGLLLVVGLSATLAPRRHRFRR
jgi:LPXTG-motif cell wall-anchored protein